MFQNIKNKKRTGLKYPIVETISGMDTIFRCNYFWGRLGGRATYDWLMVALNTIGQS